MISLWIPRPAQGAGNPSLTFPGSFPGLGAQPSSLAHRAGMRASCPKPLLGTRCHEQGRECHAPGPIAREGNAKPHVSGPAQGTGTQPSD